MISTIRNSPANTSPSTEIFEALAPRFLEISLQFFATHVDAERLGRLGAAMRNGLGDGAEAHCFDKTTLAPRAMRQADVKAFSPRLAQMRYQSLYVAVEAERAGDIVGGPNRQDCEGNVTVGEPTGDPRHGAVSAGDDHEIPLLTEGPSCSLSLLIDWYLGRSPAALELAHQLFSIWVCSAGGRIVK